MSTINANSKRSLNGNQPLLPASRPNSASFEPVPRVPTYSLITWTFGRGSVIWRIWPAVFLYTLFAAVISTLSIRGVLYLQIPNIMLTVLGVVIGFVISYRAGSGYERYWLGRGYWSDIVRNSRSLSRLIWFHVPLRLSPRTPEEIKLGHSQRSVQEMTKLMAEKTMALDLIHGFALAVKHHLRGEAGIYYEDLFHLVRPLHDHDHTADNDYTHASSSALPPPRRAHQITTQVNAEQSGIAGLGGNGASGSPHLWSRPVPIEQHPDPSNNAYGTFDASTQLETNAPMRPRSSSRASRLSSISSVNQPLLPSVQPPPETGVLDKVAQDLIPFATGWAGLNNGSVNAKRENSPYTVKRRWQGPVQSAMPTKHHPRVAGDGENLPVEIVRCLSEWFSVLEDRNVASPTTMGPLIGALGAFEDSLTGLERILTTPLPFVYSVHISTVWLYLFFLPFQLVSQFGYYTIPGVAMAAFIYLGFVAAGEEIEQPFGYDDNDLDLDLFCNEIIGVDIYHLKTAPALNVYLGPLQEDPLYLHRRSMTLNEIANSWEATDSEGGLISPVLKA